MEIFFLCGIFERVIFLLCVLLNFFWGDEDEVVVGEILKVLIILNGIVF